MTDSAPGPDPAPASAGEITGYLLINRDRFTREALDAALLAAGHQHAEIAAAWASLGVPLNPVAGEPAVEPAAAATAASEPLGGAYRVAGCAVLVAVAAGGVGIATWITVVWGAGLPDYPGDRPHGSVTDYLPIVLSIVALVGAATWSLRRLWGAARALAGLASLAIVTVYGGSCTAGYVAYTIDQYHGSRALGAELLFIMALPIAAAWSLRRLWGSAGVGGGIAGARRAAFRAALLYAAICGVCLSLALVAGA